jgi:hypothetical protein
MSKQFTAKHKSEGPGGASTRLNIPFNIEKEFGSRARVSVKRTINGFEFRTSIFPNGGGTHHMMVNKAMQQGAKAQLADTVRLTLGRDDEPKGIDIPSELKQL